MVAYNRYSLYSQKLILKSKLQQMIYQQTHKNYHPPRYIAFKNKSHSKDHKAPSSQSHQDCLDKHDMDDVTTRISPKRKGSCSTTHKSSGKTTGLWGLESVGGGQHQECLLILEGMDRKIKGLMREITSLMEYVLSEKCGGEVNRHVLEGYKGMEDRDVERQYKFFKEKIANYHQITHERTQQGCEVGTMVDDNPESQEHKQPKFDRFELDQVFELTLLPTFAKSENYVQTDPQTILEDEKGLSHLETSLSQEKNKMIELELHHKIVEICFKPENTKVEQFSQTDPQSHSEDEHNPLPVTKKYSQISRKEPQNMKHRINYMSSKAELFKRKYAKIESELQTLLKEKEETDRINCQVAEEIIKLRAESLNSKYKR